MNQDQTYPITDTGRMTKIVRRQPVKERSGGFPTPHNFHNDSD